MKIINTVFLFFALLAALSCSRAEIPQSWKADWADPPASCRPIKIAHRIPADELPYGGSYFTYLRDSCGAGGLVINYSGPDYLRDEAQWEFLKDEARRAAEAGLRVQNILNFTLNVI